MKPAVPKRPRCPVCAEVMTGDSRPARAYVCGSCGSAWVPRLALGPHAVPTKALPRARDADRRPCPGCDRLMALRGDDALQIDVCVYCGGLFLDPGELEALKRWKAKAPARSNPPTVSSAGLAAAEASSETVIETLIDFLTSL